MRSRILMVICLLSLILIASPGSAWWTELKPGNKGIHWRLTMLSKRQFEKNGLWFVSELIEGSRDPDRKSHIQAAFMHGKTINRARNSFCAGLKPWLKNDRRWAARRLARAFHYLQDHGDPTDQISGKRRVHVRNLAFQILTKGNISLQELRLQRATLKQQQRIVGAMNYNQMMGHLGSYAREIGRRINNHYDRFRRGSPRRDALVRSELRKIIASINATQDRLIVLYAREAFLQKNGRNSMCAIVQVRSKRGMFYNVSTPPYGGGRMCLTPKGAARIRSGGGSGWKHSATPLNIPCDNASD